MQFKKYTKQRNRSIQGLRSLKDTLPKNIKIIGDLSLVKIYLIFAIQSHLEIQINLI